MIDIVGIGDDGLDSLSRAVQERLATAPLIVGGQRHLNLIASLTGEDGQRRMTYPKPLRQGLRTLLTEAGDAVVLASGDPLRSGVATTLIEELGRDAVRVHANISSETLVRARMGWPAEETDVVTLVGRDTSRLAPFITPGAKLVVLCSNGESPTVICRALTARGAGDAAVTAWWHLGSDEEGSRTTTARGWGSDVTPDLVTLAVQVPATTVMRSDDIGPVPGRSDDAFAHDGLITKRDIRAAGLAHLRPLPGQLLWDLGAGSGAIAVEWVLAAPRARAIAVERRPDRLSRIGDNLRTFGVEHHVTVSALDTDTAVDELEAPDAVMLGGGVSEHVVLTAMSRLKPGGRMVGHAVTVETEQLLLAAWQRYGGHLSRISVEHLEPLGTMFGYKPARTVTQWSYVKEGTNA